MKKGITVASIIMASSVAFGMEVENFGLQGLQANVQAQYINYKDKNYAKNNESIIFLEHSKKDVFLNDINDSLIGNINIYVDYLGINNKGNYGGGINYLAKSEELLYGIGVRLYNSYKGYKGLINIYTGYEEVEGDGKFIFNPYFYLSKNKEIEKNDFGVNLRYVNKIDTELLEDLKYEIGGTYIKDSKVKNKVKRNVNHKKNEYITTDVSLSNSNIFYMYNTDVKIKEKITYDYKFKDKIKQTDVRDKIGVGVEIEIKKGNVSYLLENQIKKNLNNSNYEYTTTLKINYKF